MGISKTTVSMVLTEVLGIKCVFLGIWDNECSHVLTKHERDSPIVNV